MMQGPNIKRFYIEGAVADQGHLMRKQAHEEMRLKKRMFSEGHVPVLDIAPLVGVTYDSEKETFRYVITMYGVEVDEQWKYEGWLNGQLVLATSGTQFERLSNRLELT